MGRLAVQITEEERDAIKRGSNLGSYVSNGQSKAAVMSLTHLSDEEVIEEIKLGKGPENYQAALAAEARKRGLEI